MSERDLYPNLPEYLREHLLDIEGTSSTVEALLQIHTEPSDPVTDDMVEQAESWLLDHNIECCPNCNWWTESCEIIMAEHGDILGCYSCTRLPD